MKKVFIILLILAPLTLAGCGEEKQGTRTPESELEWKDAEVIPGRLLVKLKRESEGNFPALEIGIPYGLSRVFTPDPAAAEREREAGLHLWYIVTFDESVPVSAVYSKLVAMPEFEIVEPDYFAQIGAD